MATRMHSYSWLLETTKSMRYAFPLHIGICFTPVKEEICAISQKLYMTWKRLSGRSSFESFNKAATEKMKPRKCAFKLNWKIERFVQVAMTMPNKWKPYSGVERAHVCMGMFRCFMHRANSRRKVTG
ncbi:hypothetical protein Nepgr_012830 [Nepenthes gracilis]|uniref:Uncharacterized protein n=1 Tax=Nepenthes gracilis TaxID=150966 RepID=A0AAD3SHY8_NEPGR|nr:hypothetical protein Nepgr_012830 [Nepenthes gracilis]